MCIQRFDRCTKCRRSFNQKTKQCDSNKSQNKGWLAMCFGVRRVCNRIVRTEPVDLEWYCGRCRGPITAPMLPHQMMSYRGPAWQDPPPLSSRQKQQQEQQQRQHQKKGKKPHVERAVTAPLTAAKKSDTERNLTRSNAIRRHRATSDASALQRPVEVRVASERTRQLRREYRSVAARSGGPEDDGSQRRKKHKGDLRVTVPLYIPSPGDPTNPNIAWAKHVVENSQGASLAPKVRRDGERPRSSLSGPPAGFTYEKWQTEDVPQRQRSVKAAAAPTSHSSQSRAKISHPPVTHHTMRPRAASAGAAVRGLITPMFKRAVSPDWACADAKRIEKGGKK